MYGGLVDRCTINNNIVSDVYVNTRVDHMIDGLTFFMNESGLASIQEGMTIELHLVQCASAFVRMI